MRSFVDLFPFFLEVREISLLMDYITISKATIRAGKIPTIVFHPTTSTPRPLKTITKSLRIFGGNSILNSHGRVLIKEPLLRHKLT